jgi:hypothetical protein
MSNDGGRDADGPRGWWSRMSRSEQIVAAVAAAVVTGLCGIIAAVIISSHSSPPSPATSSPALVTASGPLSPTPGTTGQTNGKAGQTTGSPSASERFHGTITIGQAGVELDASPPTTSGSSDTFFDIAGYLHPGNGMIAQWTGSSAPTQAQCHDWALSNSVNQLQLTSGMQLCVLTASQRTAYVEITSVAADGSTATATAIVWN